jgi:hypothetical protein
MKRKAVAPTRVVLREDILKIDPPLFAFDYTADQWTKIKATLATRATPGFYDLEKVCGDLRAIACCYRWRAACHEGATKWAEHLDRQWLTVADAAETIMENMEIAGVPPEEGDDRIACWEQANAMLRIARKHLRGNIDVDPRRLLQHGMLPAEYAHALARYLKGQRRDRGLDPKERYLFEVLDVWSACGGKDTYTSDHSVDRGKRVKGPLAQFFAAVTGPVCGGSTDSLSGPRGILARYRNYKKRREQGRQPGP